MRADILREGERGDASSQADRDWIPDLDVILHDKVDRCGTSLEEEGKDRSEYGRDVQGYPDVDQAVEAGGEYSVTTVIMGL